MTKSDPSRTQVALIRASITRTWSMYVLPVGFFEVCEINELTMLVFFLKVYHGAEWVPVISGYNYVFSGICNIIFCH